MTQELAPLDAEQVQSIRDQQSRAKRDLAGFSTEAMPHLTRQQVKWLGHRIQSEDDAAACKAADVDPLDILRWMADPGFRAAFEMALDNKREGFKQLTTHLLPSVVLGLMDVVESGSNKDRLNAATLILRAQGLLIDKSAAADPGQVAALFALLREQAPVEARILSTTKEADRA